VERLPSRCRRRGGPAHAIQRPSRRLAMATADRLRGRRESEGCLWTAHDVAELLGVSHEYIWQLSRESRIPTVCLGRTRRYRRESILAWLKEIESPGGRV
jgi:excisionase family DNA binding protein